MAHRVEYRARIEIVKNRLFRVLRAEWGSNPETQKAQFSLDVFRECLETGVCEARNVSYHQAGGWLVSFPGEKAPKRYGYYYNPIVGEDGRIIEEQWWETKNYGGFGYAFNEMSIYSVKFLILQIHPELKYLLNKILIDESAGASNKYNQFQYSELFKIIRTYWAHPESETLFQLGCFNLAMNENLYKLKKEKLKQILSAVMQLKKANKLYDIQLVDIQKYFKKKTDLSVVEWLDYYNWNDSKYRFAVHFPYEVFKYCQRKNITKYEYNDYIKMAIKVGHNVKDQYWKFPNDFRKFHNKVMEQQKMLEVAKYGIQQDFLKLILEPMLKFNAKVDGYDIFLSTDAMEWQKTCDTLYQCLLRNGYMRNVIMQEDIIVFVWKDGVPQATAQLDYKKKVGQFYGDERGHSHGESCEPSEEVKAAFNKWLVTFKPKKAKFYQDETVHYYKGFSEAVEGGFHTSVGTMDGQGKGSTFLIGKTYDTNFEDETIISTGSACVSTPKVFHFCSSITEISRHYAPKYYAEVKPLGPVVENNGALLTNRLQIVRAISEEEIKKILKNESKNVIRAMCN